MSRCKSCNNLMLPHKTPVLNPFSGEEEDLCNVCKAASGDTTEEHEYVGGSYPVSGVTLPKKVVE